MVEEHFGPRWARAFFLLVLAAIIVGAFYSIVALGVMPIVNTVQNWFENRTIDVDRVVTNLIASVVGGAFILLLIVLLGRRLDGLRETLGRQISDIEGAAGEIRTLRNRIEELHIKVTHQDVLESRIEEIQKQFNRLESNLADFQKDIAERDAVQEATPRPDTITASLEVNVRRCYWDEEHSRNTRTTMIAVETVFHPVNPPIQLASVELFFEGRLHSATKVPTNLIERDHTETYHFQVGGASIGDRLIKMGLEQGEAPDLAAAIREDQWDKAFLHIVAGASDFETESFLAPTPTMRLAPGTEDSQT